MRQGVLIAIAGGSGSGKSTLAEELRATIGQNQTLLISLDDYYLRQDHLDPETRALQNYDHPDAFEIKLLEQHLGALLKDETVDAPLYDFANHTRQPRSRTLTPQPYIIVEGILALHFAEIRNLATHTIFVDADETTRFQRRLSRDTKNRGRSHESVLQQWQNTAQPMYLTYCEPSKAFAQSILSGLSSFKDPCIEITRGLLR